MDYALRCGIIIQIDEVDLPIVEEYSWQYERYVWRMKKQGGQKEKLYLHRVIMHAPKRMDVEHLDGDKRNNQRSNLRISTRARNLLGPAVPRPSKSGYRNVQIRPSGRYMVIVSGQYFGDYDTAEEANEVAVHNRMLLYNARE